MSLQEKFWPEIKVANYDFMAKMEKSQVSVMVIVTGGY
jgi:hypothetical protein